MHDKDNNIKNGDFDQKSNPDKSSRPSPTNDFGTQNSIEDMLFNILNDTASPEEFSTFNTRNISNSSNSFGTQPPTHLFPHRKKQRHSGNIKNTFYRRHTGNATTIFAKFPNMQRSSFFLYLSGIILPLNRNRPYSHYLPHKYNISNLLHLYVQTVR